MSSRTRWHSDRSDSEAAPQMDRASPLGIIGNFRLPPQAFRPEQDFSNKSGRSSAGSGPSPWAYDSSSEGRTYSPAFIPVATKEELYGEPYRDSTLGANSAVPSSVEEALKYVTVAQNKKQREEQPWRYLGYPAFSAWTAADHDNFVVRRFSTLHARTLLMLQNEIVGLEGRLEELDRRCISKQSVRTDQLYLVNSGSFENDRQHHPERWGILQELTSRLEQYDRLVLYHSQLKSRPKPPSRTIRNVRNWLEWHKPAIHDAEAQFINKESDLIAMVHRDKTLLRQFLESFSWFRQLWCFRVKSKQDNSEDYRSAYDSDESVFYKDSTIDVLITIIILLLGLGMLLGPAWWLQNTETLEHRLGIICIFVPLFMVLLTSVTPVRPFETVAATSAYAALLMIFMQMGNSV